MIEAAKTDIFESGCEAIANPVNLVGVMGGGLAKQFADRFPAIVAPYRIACSSGDLREGTITAFDRGEGTTPRWLLNMPTKRHWRDDSPLELVRASLVATRNWCESHCVRSLALPPLGTGLGNLSWKAVEKEIQTAFANSEIRVVVCDAKRLLTLSKDPQREALFENVAQPPSMPTPGQWHRNWFSNMSPFEKPLEDAGISYRTPEHFFQASKTTDSSLRRIIADLPKPGDAKRFARSITLRPDWEDVKEDVMRRVLRHKFAPETKAQEQLIATGREEIVEWNNWADRYWGRTIADGIGKNRLGILLMELRQEIVREKTEHTEQNGIKIDVINVSKLRDVSSKDRECVIYVGRSAWPIAKLGLPREWELRNPFSIEKEDRGEVIAKFAEDFVKRLELRDPALLGALSRLAKVALQKGEVLLGCHCRPLSCHAEVIADLLIQRLRDAGKVVQDRQQFAIDNKDIAAMRKVRQVVDEYLRSSSPKHHLVSPLVGGYTR